MEGTDVEKKGVTAVLTAEAIMKGLVAIGSIVAVCWLGFNGMKGLLWFPIIIGFIAVLDL